MKGVRLLDLELLGHLGVTVRIGGIEFDFGRLIRVALDQVCDSGVFPPFKKTVNQKILFELRQAAAPPTRKWN